MAGKRKILLMSDDMRMHSGIATQSKEFVMGTIDHYEWVQIGGAVKHPDEGKVFDMSQAAREEYNIDNDKICLSGFSQGCMMSINLGLTAEKEYNCIVGFSGKIIDQEDLKLRKKVATRTLLIHGDVDQVVMPNFLLEAKELFNRMNFKIQTKIFKNCEHRIPVEGSSLGLGFLKKNLL